MSENPTLLTIDDEEPVRRSIRGFFEDAGFEVWEAGDGREGLALFRRKRPEVVLVDLRMPGVSGLEVIETMAAEAPEIPVVVLSGTGIITDAIEAIRKGAWDYVTKPVVNMDALEHVVNSVRERARLREETRRYQEHLEDEVLRRTQELKQLNDRLKAIVRSSRSVMACTSVSGVARQLLEEFASNMSAEDGNLYLLEDGKLVLQCALHPGGTMDSIPFPVPASSLIGKALAEKTPILVRDVSVDEGSLSSSWEGQGGSLLAFPFIDSSGRPLGIVTLHNGTPFAFTEQDREIGAVMASYSCEATRAVRAAESLRAGEKQYRELVENIDEAIYALDTDGKITYISPVIESMTGYRPEDVIGRNYSEFLSSEYESQWANDLRDALTGTAKPAELVTIKKSGEMLWVRASSRPMLDGGRVTGIQGVLTDVSDRKAAEEQLEKKAFELSVMNNLARELGFDLTIESAVQTCLQHVTRSTEPDLALIFVMEENVLVLKGIMPGTLVPPGEVLPTHHVGECLCGLALSERLPIFSGDIHADPRCTFEECKKAGLRSFGALPLISAGEIIGVLGVASY
ncbi:MAG: response regulator, partial [Syntrophobacteraceae bacterium]